MCLSETDAVRLAQQGDVAAFEYLYRSHSRRVYDICLRMVENKMEAEDLTRDAFLQAFRNIQRFPDESIFSTALLQLTVNLALKRRAACNYSSLSDVLVLDLVR